MSKTGSNVSEVRISKDIPVADANIPRGGIVRWKSLERDRCIAVFAQGSPFGKWYFEIPGGESVESGPANRDLKITEGDHLAYKYSVIFNGWQADPKVKVWP
jgi:hypothetical protein